MGIIVQFTFFTPLMVFCFYTKSYIAAVKMKTRMVACPCHPSIRRPWGLSMNPTETPTASENHKNIGGVKKFNGIVILNAYYVCDWQKN